MKAPKLGGLIQSLLCAQPVLSTEDMKTSSPQFLLRSWGRHEVPTPEQTFSQGSLRNPRWVVLSVLLCFQWEAWQPLGADQFSSVQLLSHVQLFATPWTAARQASLSITNSRSILKLMSTESVMSSKHLILCGPLLLLPSIFPSIRVFSNDTMYQFDWGCRLRQELSMGFIAESWGTLTARSTSALQAMAPHSSTLAWQIQWTEEPGRLQSMGSLEVGHNWATSLSLFTFMHWRRKWQPTPVFLPGESQGQGSLVGCRLWGRTESNMTEAT